MKLPGRTRMENFPGMPCSLLFPDCRNHLTGREKYKKEEKK
jgi:hypothetical protein